MKFVLANDIKSTIKYQKKWILLYYIVIISFISLNYFINKNDLNMEFFVESLGLDFGTINILNIVIATFHLMFFLYIAVYLFTKDLKEDKCNLFLRIKCREWLIYKNITIIIISLFLELLAISIFYLFCIFNTIPIMLYTHILINDILFIFVCESCTILSIVCQKITLFAIVPILLLILFTNGYIPSANIIIFLLLIIGYLILESYFIVKNKNYIFEKY